jgi:uncharacterized MAPEG superfamily protein
MNLPFVVFDTAVGILAVRSFLILGRRAPWTSVGWAATAGYFASAAWRYAHEGQPLRSLLVLSGVLFVVLAAAFIIAVIVDEPQAEPLLWPTRVGLTRAQKRR